MKSGAQIDSLIWQECEEQPACVEAGQHTTYSMGTRRPQYALPDGS
jgi:hypothetical protein